ncbi:Alpha/Beta hydrolase protein [Whalleya microplaca]|nr:Alpha/Beta hydrolase protein [Whalleya microplaca]
MTSIAIMFISIALILPACLVSGISIPPPTGPYNVGIKKHAIPYLNREDPVAPGSTSTSFLATIYYPTLEKPKNSQKRYLDPVTASLYEGVLNIISGTLSSLTSDLVEEAPGLGNRSPYPTLIFGPGAGGPPTECYAILSAELASHGYIVIGLDHPYEQPFVRYPNGTGIVGLPIIYDYPIPLILSIYELRLKETAILLDYLPTLESKLGIPTNTTRIGAFGHSLGGAAAAGSMLDDSRVSSAINIDGTFWGTPAENTTAADVKGPVFLFGEQGHGPGGDVSWQTFPLWQTGYWRQILVNGSLHLDFSDQTFWKTVAKLNSTSVGTIDGDRQVQIMRTFVKAFFDFSLIGDSEPVLNGPSLDWPEIDYYAGGNGTY